MYKIIGIYRGDKEVLDECEKASEADYLAAEYAMAFGPSYTIYIEEPPTRSKRPLY